MATLSKPDIDHQKSVDIASPLYLPLPSSSEYVRLIELLPVADADQLIHCKLRVVRLSDKPDYVALSYVWGDETTRRPACVNGLQITITEQLDLALRRVRDGTDERVLWADALCINQRNLAERNNQVQLMGQIFSSARRVLVFLGPTKPGLDKALATLDSSKIGQQADHLWRKGIDSTNQDGNSTQQFHLEVEGFMASITEESYAAIRDLATRPYWTRTWILQEVFVARQIDVLYGSVLLPWHLFEDLYFWITWAIYSHEVTRAETLVFFLRNVGNLCLLRRSLQQSLADEISAHVGWRELLRQHRQSIATDQHDKLFALFGIAYDLQLFITIDYAITVTETYKTFTRRCLAATKSLELMLQATREWDRSDLSRSLPSWVPDYSTAEVQTVSNDYHRYAADANKDAVFAFASSGNVLSVQGHICDQVVEIQSFERQGRALIELLTASGPYNYPSGMPRLQALFRVLTGDADTRTGLRFKDGPEEALIHSMTGFLICLGHEGLDGLTDWEQTVDELDEEDLKGSQVPMFFQCFRRWAEACFKTLDDLDRTQKPKGDDMVSTGITETEAINRQCSALPSPEDAHIELWRSSLAQTARASNVSDMLQLLLGQHGEPNTLHWPDKQVTRAQERWSAHLFVRSSGFNMRKDVVFGGRKGYIGTCHQTAREGDIIAVLRGSRVPVILRPAGSRYTFVAPCFVEGLMDGQAMGWVKDGTAQEQQFDII